MALYICSLDVSPDQLIPADGQYHLLKFPCDRAPYDPWGMHAPDHPDGYTITDWQADPRSGLIWPAASGWGTLTAEIQWAAGNYNELRDRFVRDPLGLNGGPDDTNLEDRPPTGGMQFVHKTHSIFVSEGTPLGLEVKHNATTAVAVTYAQLKLAIETDVVEP
ncbi:hypothetical protein ACF07Q_28545 [Nocardiopsis dassonvillei]|uniref:hypothetical protein n=1 Tax=Nocardiopsis dassonvillei TaxID=2014 RepID=UPI0036F5EAB4